jgi:hypothetical protein
MNLEEFIRTLREFSISFCEGFGQSLHVGANRFLNKWHRYMHVIIASNVKRINPTLPTQIKIG